MLAVLVGCVAFVPFAVASGLRLAFVWAALVGWLVCSALWKAAYRIDVSGDTIEFRTLLLRRSFPLGHVRWVRGSRSFAVVRLRHATLHLYGAVGDWDDFVASVRRANRRARFFRVT
jgi:hypothetical protein